MAEIYLESEDANNALSCLLKIPDNDIYSNYKKDGLLLIVYNKLGNREKGAEIALKIFQKNRNEENFTRLLKIVGEKEKGNIIKEELSRISKEKKFSTTNANFMIFTGLTEEAENYILEYTEQLNGDSYYSLLPLAESMENANRHLPAIVIYRALLDSILRRAKSKSYHHGARYLKKLDKLAQQINDWKEMISHKEYFDEIKKNHKRKYAFWSEYD